MNVVRFWVVKCPFRSFFPMVDNNELWGGLQMIGFLEATEGQAIINGRNIETDMNEIYTFMVRHQATQALMMHVHVATQC